MNRNYSITPRRQARSPPRRDRLQRQDARGTSSFKNQGAAKQDLNIDEFGDMGSDEDDLQSLGSSFVPPKPPAKPQYNLVPYGLLRDDDELAEEDYDGVPIDDVALRDSPQKQPWQSRPQKSQSEEMRGAPISVLDSSNRLDSQFSKWQGNITIQDSGSRNHPGLGRSPIDSNINKISDNNRQLGTGRWDKKSESASNTNLGNYRNIPSLLDSNVAKPQNFVRAQNDANPFIQPGNKQTSSLSFVRGSDDGNPFLKTRSNATDIATSSIRSTDDSNPFLKVGNRKTSSDTSNTLLPSRENIPRWNDKPKPSQGSTPVWAGKGSESSQMLKEQVQPSQNQIFTPATVANASSQLELLQAAALQQALKGLTQLSSQSGLNLLGAQNLLMQATQNPTLAAALVSTGIRSIQPNPLDNPAVEALLNSAVTTTPDVTQSRSSLLTYPLRGNTVLNSGSTPRKKPIPDGSGATRYPAPDVSSLVFDPSTGYRFDASTGLHYDANSGYFFNSELKIFLRWDKFTQTYLKVDDPPGVPRFNNSSTDRMSYMAGSLIAHQDKGLSSSFPNTAFPKENHHGLAAVMNVPTSSGLSPLMNVPTSRGLASLINPSTSSNRKDNTSVLSSSVCTIPTDFSKPPPSLPHNFSDSRFQPIGTNLSSVAEQKGAALPNFAETSLFNKLRKAKLAQTAQTKSDRKRWGSPDPLLEAARKHAAETNNSPVEILNMKEILQRSRQFMKQKIGNEGDESVDRHRKTSRSRSGDRRKARSRSRSVGRPLRRRSLSAEKPGNRRGRSSISPQQRRPPARSPESKLRGRPNSRGRSPDIRGRGRPSVSPARKRRSVPKSRSPSNRARGKESLSPERRRRRSASRGRSPAIRARGRASPLPEARKKRSASKGRSSLSRIGKSSKSPVPRNRRPISKCTSPERRRRERPSISPELRKRNYKPRTPNRSQSPKVRVVLDQSPGGSKIRVCSTGRSNKRSADRDLNAEKRKLRRKLSPSPERTRAISSGRKNMKDSVEGKTGLAGRKPVKERLGTRDNKRESSEKDKLPELKTIPCDTPQIFNEKSSKGKDVSGYKSLSNLRNQGKDKPRERETDTKEDNSRQNKDKSATGRITADVDPTADSDDDKRGRANHRLVSERTFSSGWEKKKASPVPNSSPTKKPDAKSESISAKDAEEKNEEEDTSETNTEDKKKTEESNEFDFLNDTLDDDKESTVIDEYEEILDYQDLDGLTELVEESASNHTNIDGDRVEKSLSKESLVSSVIDLYVDPKEVATETSTPADSNQESVKCSSVEDNELVKIPSEKSDSLGDRAVVPQGEEGADVTKGGEVAEEDGIELYDSEDLDGVRENVCVSDKVSDRQSLKDSNSLGTKETKEPDTCVEEVCEKVADAPSVQGDNLEGGPETKNDGKESNAVDEAVVEMKEPNKTFESKSGERVPDELGHDILENEEWSVVDSVEYPEELTKETFPSGINESGDEKQEGITKRDPVETNDSSSKPKDLESRKMEDDESGVTRNDGTTKSEDDGKTGKLETHITKNELNQELSQDNANNSQLEAQKRTLEQDSEVSKGLSRNDEPDTQASVGDGETDASHLQGSNDVDTSKGITSQTETEQLQQVRSVSDIEKFLLLSSQEVEAKREQVIDPTNVKNDKKSGVFSRLGEKLPTEEAGGEPTVVVELPSETSASAPGPSTKVSASPTKLPLPASNAKPTAASKTLNKSKKADPKDPMGMLFSDEPTSKILIGPLNFIEPIQNFQQFTQRYMTRLLQRDKVNFRKVFVCHEDVTGAPYHYIIIFFHTVGEASDWFKKHKGRFKAEQNMFKRVSGHLKHKFIPGAESFLHFTEGNWVCKVCKKGNFPPRSLCFNCFHHKYPEGFSPLTILDKGPPPHKHSNFVGAPKLKFFVTKEKVIESAPPLDGFDIKSIEMIMDEEMGLPAGICVFELPNYIDAGKFKKYLNHREVEAVSVEMHEKPMPVLIGPPKVSGSDTHRRPSEEKEYLESGGIEELSSRFPSQEVRSPRDVRVLRGGSPSPVRDIRIPRGRLHTPPRDGRVPRGRSPSPSRDVRVPRGLLPTPPRDVRVPWGRSPSPSRDVRVPRGHLPTPPRDVRVPRGRSPSPVRDVRVPRRRSPSPFRDIRAARGGRVRSPSPEVRIPRSRLPSPSRDSRFPRARSRSTSWDSRFPRGRSPSPLRQRHSRERVLSRSPRRHSPGYLTATCSREVYGGKRYPSPEGRSLGEIPRRGRPTREFDNKAEPRRLQSRERVSGYLPPVPRHSPGYRSPPRYRSRSPVYDSPRRRSLSPRYRSPSPLRPAKPDGRGDWRYPPPDPNSFRYEPKSGLDYDPATTLYYDARSCCFYNDDTNEWLEYNPITGRYTSVR